MRDARQVSGCVGGGIGMGIDYGKLLHKPREPITQAVVWPAERGAASAGRVALWFPKQMTRRVALSLFGRSPTRLSYLSRRIDQWGPIKQWGPIFKTIQQAGIKRVAYTTRGKHKLSIDSPLILPIYPSKPSYLCLDVSIK